MDGNEQFKNVNPDIKDFVEHVERLLHTRDLHAFRVSFFEKMIILLISAFGLIAALAWDEAFKALFSSVFGHLSVLQEKFLYAGAITVFAVLFSIVLSKFLIKRN